ncbi:MAG: EF-hand domain-containing protein [Nibricoccus sp.]
MKPSSLVPALFAATLFLIPALPAKDASTDEMTDTPEKQAMSKEQQADILKRFDKNGDGKLDEDEKAAAKEYNRETTAGRQGKAREKIHKKALEKFDKNGDGKLDESERAEAIKAIENDPRLVRRFDKDGDGKLNDAEKAAAREAFAKMRDKGAGKNE